MAFIDIELSHSYWESLEINQEDIDFLYTHLLEKETPSTSEELVEALISERIRTERQSLQEKQEKNGEIYLPKLDFEVGQKVQFPAINWINGEVVGVRQGNNPEKPTMKVMTVALENGDNRQFATNLEDHRLNEVTTTTDDDEATNENEIIEDFGDEIITKLEEKLDENKDLVRIGAEWFPKSLLIEFNIGHLNLAEAILDMHGGGPLSVDSLLKEIDIDSDDPEKLIEFSLNNALQEDPRFDEVGPSGVVQWFLNRLEPEYVRKKPLQLQFTPIEHDRTALSEDMLKAEQKIDDELVELQTDTKRKAPAKETTIVLNYPHWRIGSLPLTHNTRPFFPTAIDSPRVKFSLVDTAHNEEISAWVVRPFNYIYGLREWYDELELMPGSIIKIRHGKQPGEVFIEAAKKRSNREWIRTLLIGADGGVVFALLKQTITADFNERMAIAVPSTEVLDELWKKSVNNPRPMKDTIIRTMKELAKLNPQGHVHAIELYAALNCVRRCPPGVLFSILASNLEFSAVGDLYYRLSNDA